MLSVVALLAICSFQQESKMPPGLPATRVNELIEAFNTKDDLKIGNMVTRNFAKSALEKTTKDEWVDQIHAAATNLAPISIDKVLKTTDQFVVVKLKGKTNMALALRVDFEQDQPFGISAAKLGDPDELLGVKPPSPFGEWSSLDDLAEAVRKNYKLPAVCLAFERLGSPAEEAVTGVRYTNNRGGAIRPSDRLLVGAIGEAMTATLIAKFIEVGKFGWNTTLADALPNFEMQDSYKKVTIDQLLHHRSGLPQDLRMSQEDLDRIVGKAEEPTDIRKAYVKDVLRRAPSGPSDSQMRYSTADYVVAACILETVMHKSYEYLMDRYVFSPMKMTTALIAPVGTEDQVGTQNTVFGHVLGDLGYAVYDMPPTKLDCMWAPNGAGVSCSIGDLLKFADFHLRGLKGDAKVLTAESYKRLHTAPEGESPDEVACGWIVNPMFAHEPCLYRSGANGSFYADLTLWPERDLAIVAVTNAGTMRQPSPTMQAIMAIRDKFDKK